MFAPKTPDAYARAESIIAESESQAMFEWLKDTPCVIEACGIYTTATDDGISYGYDMAATGITRRAAIDHIARQF